MILVHTDCSFCLLRVLEALCRAALQMLCTEVSKVLTMHTGMFTAITKCCPDQPCGANVCGRGGVHVCRCGCVHVCVHGEVCMCVGLYMCVYMCMHGEMCGGVEVCVCRSAQDFYPCDLFLQNAGQTSLIEQMCAHVGICACVVCIYAEA